LRKMSISPAGPRPYSEEWWQVALSSIGDGVIVTDSRGDIAFINPAAESLTRWTNGEARGKAVDDVFEIVNDSTNAVVENPIRRVLQSGQAVQLANHTILLARDGSRFSIDDSAAPIKDKNGVVTGAVLVFRDISETYEAQRAQRQLAAIVESSNDAILSEDLEGTILSWNSGAEVIYGYKASELVGKNIRTVVPPDRSGEISTMRATILRGERIEHFETVRLKKDGTLIDVSIAASPLKNSAGEIIAISKIARDISARKNAEREHAYLAAIVASSDDAIVSKSLQSVITSWNAAAERMFGYTAAEAIGQLVYLIIPPERHGEEAEIISGLNRGERIEHLETVRRRKDGTLIDVSLTISPIKDKNGVVIGASKIARDITERKRAERERAHLAAIIESSDDAIVSKTLDSVITSWNKAAEKMFGYTAEEAVGRQVYLIIPPERQGEETEILARIRRGEKIDHYETVRQRKDGAMLHVSLTVSPIKDSEGNIVGASKIARDITERRKAIEEIEAGRQTLQIVNRVGQTLSSELDLEKVVQSLTDAATKATGAAFGAFFYNVMDEQGASYMLYTLSGVPRSHFEGFPMPRATDLFAPTFLGEAVVRSDNVTADPRYGKNPPHFGLPKGHLPVTSYLAVPVRSRSGEVLGGLFFGHPERAAFSLQHEQIVVGLAGQAASAIDNARLYEATRAARTEAENANRLKDEFLATVSHELRTPLNAILGWARLLHTGQLDEDARKRAVETIERSAVAQGQLIEDILDVSRIITGKLRLEVAPVDIGRVVAEAVESVRPSADAKQVRLQTVLDTRTNIIRGDAHRLQQILWNLLSNAIKFTPKGGRVHVAISRVASHVEIAVNDTGQGIKREFLPYVFDRFRQADSSSVRTHGGLGLGLAIVRHLTELHGGTVSAASPGEGQGATFTVLLPVPAVHDETQRQRPQVATLPAVGGKLVMPDGAVLKGVRVLVVDDEADARDLLGVVLNKCGAEVRIAASTREALTILNEWTPDVLVSDIGMPGEDGYELIHQVRARSHNAGGSIPAAALTAYATAEDRLRVLTAGFQIHVAKPVEPVELIAVVASLAGKTGLARG
jgi:PAS domain S-box-containing protein